MSNYHVAVVGATGAVGQQMLKTIRGERFSYCKFKITFFKAFCWESFNL
ncbi:aspartate-semialdehyde dehydrogenase [Halalkalibacter wakoensis JCM 9140]|uniref:Aspartate-semialdehyde dehydrogenase n=1 Tax=Halalkalibacter wakoensis JCM 9140 TaxID=1236970 RepID=W4PYV5_9BACI|nr:aspartate-semialdehyde dehydrogenase [Halalkalibacter wakoensis JCM 9140]